MNAGPFSARLLTNAPLPKWLKEPENVKVAARQAAALCTKRGVDIAKLALQFSVGNTDIATTIAGSANPQNIRSWANWVEEPMDEQLRPRCSTFSNQKNVGHKEGLPRTTDGLQDIERCISLFTDLGTALTLDPLSVLFTGFAFTGAGRGQGEGAFAKIRIQRAREMQPLMHL
jgi:hypothetical protein